MKSFQKLNWIVIAITINGKFWKYWWGNLLTRTYEVFWGLYKLVITDNNALLKTCAKPSRPYEKIISDHFYLCKNIICLVENWVLLCDIKLAESFEGNTSNITLELKPYAKLTLELMFSNLGPTKYRTFSRNFPADITLYIWDYDLKEVL